MNDYLSKRELGLMSVFRDSKSQVEQGAILALLQKLEQDPSVSQRSLSEDLGIAFGLVNTYLKRCVHKGWIKIQTVPSKRYLYFLTPAGFQEKSRLVHNYLVHSLAFFRQARAESEALLQHCVHYGYQKVGLVGAGELAEIVLLVAKQFDLYAFFIDNNNLLSVDYDALLITDINSPQATYDGLQKRVGTQKIMYLPLLHISVGVDKSGNTLR